MTEIFTRTDYPDDESRPVDDIEFKIARLDLRPGDILVVRFKDRLPSTTVERVQDMFKRIAPGVKVLVLENGADLAILTPAEIEVRTDAA